MVSGIFPLTLGAEKSLLYKGLLSISTQERTRSVKKSDIDSCMPGDDCKPLKYCMLLARHPL
jgi:hypothetical protein